MATFIKCNSSGKFLAVNSAQGSNNAGTGLIQYDYTGDGTQQWAIVPKTSSSSCLILNIASGKVIDVPGSTQKAGTQLIQWYENDNENQLWNQINVTGGVAFQNVATNQFINVAGASNNDGASIIQYPESINSIQSNSVWSLSSNPRYDPSQPPDDGSGDDDFSPSIHWNTIVFDGDELHNNEMQILSDYLTGAGTIAVSHTATIGWQINFSLQINIPIVGLFFSAINATFGGQYSQSFTTSITYTTTIPAGETARIVYIPGYHRRSGIATITQPWEIASEGPVKTIHRGTRIVGGGPTYIDVYMPLPDGGVYTLEQR
jgi:hypothetical protein